MSGRRAALLAALVLLALALLPAGARAGSQDSRPPAPGSQQAGLASTLAGAVRAEVAAGLDKLSGSLGGVFTGAIDLWMTTQAESWLSNVAGSFGSLFLYTPPMRNPEAPWIWTGWNYAFLLSLLLDGAAILWHGWKLARPDSEERGHMGTRLLVVAIAIAGSYLSLYLIDAGIAVQNQVWSGLLQDLLHWNRQQASRPEAGLVLGLVFGQGAGSIAGLVGSMGLLPGLLPVLLISALALLALTREILLVMLAVASPLYVTFTGFASDPAPLVGCLYVYVRTLLVQSLFGAAWLVLAFVESGALRFMGFSPGFLTTIVLALTLAGAWIWWVRPVAKALAHPLSLGGAAVLAGVAALGERVGQALGIAGTLTAQPELAASGVAVREAAQRFAKIGRGLQSGYDPHLPAASRLPPPPERHGHPLLHTKRALEDDQGQPWSAFRVPASQRARVLGALQEADIAAQVKGDELWVLPSQEPAAERLITGVFRDAIPYWTHSDRFVVIKDGLPQVLNTPPPRGVEMGAWTGRW